MELSLFFLLALIAMLAAGGMLLSRNAVYSALFLIVNFATVAVFFLLLGAPFIAMAQVTVYAGAIMVLFLFVIMLLGAERLRQKSVLPWQAPLAVVLGIVLLVEAGVVIVTRGLGAPPPALSETAAAGFGGPQAIGASLFTTYLLPFEVTSVLLLAAMVGAIVLTRDEKGKSQIPNSKSQTGK
ncbi:MAG: NADH-quinone oxidoreductase subunit J [Chloroflexi bacterium]|nr:NADH-quinone oxidoreductase subunit J [Chloroflexota bacterium]